MFDVNGIEIPGIHFQDQKIAITIIEKKQISETMNEQNIQSIIEQKIEQCTIYIYVQRPSYK